MKGDKGFIPVSIATGMHGPAGPGDFTCTAARSHRCDSGLPAQPYMLDGDAYYEGRAACRAHWVSGWGEP